VSVYCKYSDQPAGSGATELVLFGTVKAINFNIKFFMT
jgi:hypothetical protein